MHQTGPHNLDPIVQPGPRFARVYEVVDREGLGFAERIAARRIGLQVQAVAAGTLVDRLGMRVGRSLYSAKPYVLFHTTTRVGGGV